MYSGKINISRKLKETRNDTVGVSFTIGRLKEQKTMQVPA